MVETSSALHNKNASRPSVEAETTDTVRAALQAARGGGFIMATENFGCRNQLYTEFSTKVSNSKQTKLRLRKR
jgi:hypothetical protein